MSRRQEDEDIPFPPTEDEDQPSAKRAKVFRACNQCVSSKTRCEEVKANGCWLCRRKRKTCSLAGAVGEVDVARSASKNHGTASTRQNSEVPPPANWRSESQGMGMDGLAESNGRLREAESRIAALEREMAEMRSMRILPTGGMPFSIAGPSSIQANPGKYSRINHIAHYAQLEDFSETVFSLGTPEPFPSVISAGLLSQSDIDLAFQSFKHHFSTILPLAPFLSISTPTPTHNFVIIACLHHVPIHATSQLAGLVDESILLALTGNISHEVVLALLILALAPSISTARGQRCRPTPLRLISLAYQFGLDLGLDCRVEALLRRGDDLGEPFWTGSMELVQMWSAVINRYIILHLLHGHGRSLPQSLADRIPHSANSHVQQTTLHLLDESSLAHYAADAMSPLMAVEAGQQEYDEVKRAMQSFEAGFKRLVEWKRAAGSPLLNLEQRCLEYIAVSRLSFLFQRIPSPLQPIRGILIAGLTAFIATAQRFLSTLFPDPIPSTNLSYDPQSLRLTTSPSTSTLSPNSLYQIPISTVPETDPRFPSHVSMCASLAVLALRGAAVHVRLSPGGTEVDIANMLQIPRLRRAETCLRGLGGNAEEVLRQADEAFGTLEEELQRSVEASAAITNMAAGFAPGGSSQTPMWDPGADLMMGTALFDFDLFSWDPSLLAPGWNSNGDAGGSHT